MSTEIGYTARLMNDRPATTRTWHDWLALGRAPLAAIAMADPLAGAILAGVGWTQTPAVVALMLAAGGLHAGAAMLNDWHDWKHDLRLYPTRVLPSRRIHPFWALGASALLLIVGTILTTVPGREATRIGLGILALVVIYNLLLKDLPISPLLKAGPRPLGVWLGMTVVEHPPASSFWAIQLTALATVALYALGLMLLTKGPARKLTPRILLAAGILLVAAVLLIPLLAMMGAFHSPHRIGLLWVLMTVAPLIYVLVRTRSVPGPASNRAVVRVAQVASLGLLTALTVYARGLLWGMPVAIMVAAPILLQRQLRLDPADL